MASSTGTVSAFLLIVAIAGCTIDTVREADRNSSKALKVATNIRDAEQFFFRKNGTYTSLQQLAAKDTKLIPTEVADGVHFGYSFRLELCQNGFSLTVRPLKYGETGSRSFYLDESGAVYETYEDKVPDTSSHRVQ
jgi:hypothetical protein